MEGKRYYSSKDIQGILGVSKSKANEIMHMFDQRGLLFRSGKVMRVRVTYFEDWLEHQDGQERRERMLEEKLLHGRARA